MASVTVLLCTYNSEEYVRPLVDSILNNDYSDFELIVQDDCSTDRTAEILSLYDDPRIRFKANAQPSGGAAANFMSSLLSHSTADYIMFADADDYWERNKIRKTLEEMQQMEKEFGKETPLLVHSDLSVVDRNLNLISSSLWQYEKISPERTELRQLLAQNNVTGCAMMINRALKDLVPYAPEHYVMHDWWFALCASAFGKIGVIHESLIRYRQHGDNSVGAYDAGSLTASAKKLRNKERISRIYGQMFAQAECFASYYSDRLTAQQESVCRAYADMGSRNRFGKICSVIRYGFWKNTLLRNLGQFIAM